MLYGDAAIEVGPVLVHEVGAGEQTAQNLALDTDGRHLAPRIHELVGVIGKEIEVQTVAANCCRSPAGRRGS